MFHQVFILSPCTASQAGFEAFGNAAEVKNGKVLSSRNCCSSFGKGHKISQQPIEEECSKLVIFTEKKD